MPELQLEFVLHEFVGANPAGSSSVPADEASLKGLVVRLETPRTSDWPLHV